MIKPTVFISYSHLDEEWKDRLVRHLAVLQKQGRLELWHDQMIGAGADWERQIQAAMDAASVAILLVSANSLTSDFILREEVSRLLERRASEGLRIFPVVIKPFDLGAVDWLRRMNLRPRDGKPLSGGNEHEIDQAFTDIAIEIRELLKRTAPPVTATFVPLNPGEISTSRLPRLLTPHLFGRDDELQLLDKAWADPHTNIVTFVAWGGVGKSALVSHWLMRLEQENFRGAERVYAWSFYSRGTSDHAATAEYFINDALRWFGGHELADQLATVSPWEKGEWLARFVRQTRTLLILDGLEPVQHPPGPQEGRLKEQSLQALLRELAAQQPGLCVVTTREAIGDLTQYEGRTVVRNELTHLSPQAGAQLLRELKVKGTEAELEAAANEYGGHSLALTLLGSYLGDVYEGDVRRRHEIESLEEDVRHGWQVRRMMRAYEKWLGDGPELAVLRLLGLFDRPADAASIAALRSAPAIPGLTEALQNLPGHVWRQTLAKLRRIKLLVAETSNEPDTLDSHMLVHEHFRQQHKRVRPEAWREGNSRLYDHLKNTAKGFPETIEEMSPLYTAIVHGCEAGRAEEALKDVYLRRIVRITRKDKYFNTARLGAVDADLAALRSFFESPWHQPLSLLNEADKACVLHEAGYDLRAMGRLAEAADPLQKSLEIYISLNEWESATINAGQLNQLYLSRGDISKALEYAISCEEYANRSGLRVWHAKQRATYAKTIHQMGDLDKAEAAFKEAENIYKQNEPYLYLVNQWGFMYCSLLLDKGKYEEVQVRAEHSLNLLDVENQTQLLEIALDHLSLGRAFLMQARLGGTHDFPKCLLHLNEAVSKLHESGRRDHLPRGLLARAELHRLRENCSEAWDDLNKAMSIATRSDMRLHLADCHLEAARLSLATGDGAAARKAWETAKAMIEEMGYHRRDGEVAEIEEQLG